MNDESERHKVRVLIEVELGLAAGALRRAYRYRQEAAEAEKWQRENEWHAERHKLRALLLEHALHSTGYARLSDVHAALVRLDLDMAGRLEDQEDEEDEASEEDGNG
jgi:hypothetical protein